jgi:PPK2 family polyphosphate:nucleotide phosphotransferase
MAEQALIPPYGKPVRLSDYDPAYRGDWDKQSAAAEVERLQAEMQTLQERLYAENKQSLLIVLQALDAGGKDSTIKKVFEGINPQGVRVHSFKQPSSLELAHDFLWRVHKRTPEKGYIGIFNRSHYEDVLVVRVNGLAPQSVWEKRYDHINHFEQLLADNGTKIIKFFLYISREEQKERFQDRLNKPDKHWKFSKGDLVVREQWDDYIAAYETVLSRCNTPEAPWHIIPANRKWYRNLVVTQTIVNTLQAMNPQYPPPEEGLDQVVIPN